MSPIGPKDGPKDREGQGSPVPSARRDADAGASRELLRRSKVSPYLRAEAVAWERRKKEVSGPAAVPVVSVLIELKGPDTSELQRAHVDFKPLFGSFFSANVPLDRLDDLAELESILRIHHEERQKPGLDDSIPEIKASTVRNSQYPFAGTNKFTGLGVMVGIIDSGMNILHPVFRLPNDPTKTRIRALLDQTQNPPVTYTKAQIEAAIAADKQIIQPGTMVGGKRVEKDTDDHKHGTHVAGIAAGNGKKAGNCSGEFKYVGVAPEAELVIVKYDFAGVASLQAAIKFISGVAAAVPVSGVPVVINMSLGHSIGPHDGTDPMDQMIDNYLLVRSLLPPPAVVLVTSAGNEGSEGTHATGNIAAGGTVKRLRFEINAEKSIAGQAKTFLEIRFAAANGMGCRLIPPGNNISGGPNLAAPDGVASFVEVTRKSTCQINGSLVPGGAAGSRRINISVMADTTKKLEEQVNQPGEWVVELTNAGPTPITYHAWIKGDQWDKLKDDVSRASTIGSPGSATNIITVGNYASSGKDEGKIAGSSSRGPRLDGLPKPDLSAPGVDICSAKRDLHIGCCCDCCCDSYIDMSGTSMAAPHVTGAIALMLERNSQLTHQQIKGILITNARRDSYTGAAANNDFGAGKLDVLALLNDPLVRGAGATITRSLAPPPTSDPRLVGAQAIVTELPIIPQLATGTPLWRLLNTAEGQRLYELGRTHWEEVRTLVNTQKRVAAVWHRNQGPLLLHHVTRTVMLPHVPLPRELDGVEISVRAARMVSALERYASKELIRAMHETLPLIARLHGKTLLELVEVFESSQELQHA